LRYDAEGAYVKKWLPVLAKIDDLEAVFRPWNFDVPGFQNPIVDPSSQLTWQDLKRLEETNKLIDDGQE
jgi:deoxyribodipyrimidine photolyase